MIQVRMAISYWKPLNLAMGGVHKNQFHEDLATPPKTILDLKSQCSTASGLIPSPDTHPMVQSGEQSVGLHKAPLSLHLNGIRHLRRKNRQKLEVSVYQKAVFYL
jgi:hypothetical protein